MKLDDLTAEFLKKHPESCAALPINRYQKIKMALILLALVFLLLYRWDYFMLTISLFMIIVYLASGIFRVTASVLSLKKCGILPTPPERIQALTDEDLPVYTILLPLYKEANIAEKIMRSIAKLDYPHEKLDVKILLEADDHETINAVYAGDLQSWCDVIVVPDFKPKTKPRACNFGLQAAKGEFCVIFDAEDIPEPDQLKKAVAAFRDDRQNQYACVQAKLNYYNAKYNLLTKLFTIEYSTAFDLTLPGLSKLGVPLPLGGTSNHFRTDVLKKLGGWDPFNVTEDCDLGIRIYELNYHTAVIESTTWEEANCQVWNWIRQRSRWVKGFIQTHYAHCRNNISLLRRLGLWGYFGFLMMVGGSSFMILVNLIFWLTMTIYAVLAIHAMCNGVEFMEIIRGPQFFKEYQGMQIGPFQLRAWPLFYWGAEENSLSAGWSVSMFIISLALFFNNFIFIGIHIAACVRRKFNYLICYALLMPFYWLMISVAGWKGFWQFFTKPFYWEKTLHGLHDDNLIQSNHFQAGDLQNDKI